MDGSDDETAGVAAVPLELEEEVIAQPDSIRLLGETTILYKDRPTSRCCYTTRYILQFVGFLLVFVGSCVQTIMAVVGFSSGTFSGWRLVSAIGLMMLFSALAFRMVRNNFSGTAIRFAESGGCIEVCDGSWSNPRRFECSQIERMEIHHHLLLNNNAAYESQDDFYYTIKVHETGGGSKTFVGQVREEIEAQYIVQQVQSFLKLSASASVPLSNVV